MELHGKNLIGYRWQVGEGVAFQARNPRSDEPLACEFFDASLLQVDEAMELAAQAAEELHGIRHEKKAKFLEAIAERILAQGEALLELCRAETALPIARLTAERGRTVAQLRMFADAIREGSCFELRIEHAIAGRTPRPKPDLRSMQRALGPVVVFGASNFPLAYSVAGGDSASAIAAGCPIIVKAHPKHPGTSELVAFAICKAAQETGMPQGTFSLLHGNSVRVGMDLVRHPLTKAIGFTGSLAGGRAIFDAAMTRDEPIPVFAEMGSTNPVFFLPEILREKAKELAQTLSRSVQLGVGQFCTNPGLVFIIEDETSASFIEELSACMSTADVGHMLHEGIAAAFTERTARLEAIRGVERKSKPPSREEGTCTAHPALFVTDAETFRAQSVLGEECFGPSTLVVLCASSEQMLTLASELHGQLTASLHGNSNDLNKFEALARILEDKVGRLVFNNMPTGVEVCAAMQHGGPYPATTHSQSSSVGTTAMRRFMRPICYQSCPTAVLPVELRDENPQKMPRWVDGVWESGRATL